MDELIEKLKSRANLSDEKAREVAGMAIDFVKDKLPEPIAGQLDKLLAGGGDALGNLTANLPGGLGDKLGGLLGGKKD